MKSTKLETLELSARSYNFLRKANITSIEQLVTIRKISELFALAKTSPRNISDLEEMVKREGYIWNLEYDE